LLLDFQLQKQITFSRKRHLFFYSLSQRKFVSSLITSCKTHLYVLFMIHRLLQWTAQHLVINSL